MPKRNYVPVEDWERWCNKKKKKVKLYKAILNTQKDQIAMMDGWIRCSITTRMNLSRGGTKEGSFLQKKMDLMTWDLDFHKSSIAETKDKILNKIAKWLDYAEDCLPQTETENMPYDVLDTINAENDNTHLQEFIRFTENKIHDWDSP